MHSNFRYAERAGVASLRLSLLPVLTIAAFTLSSLLWILHDVTVWPWDQAWYAEVTLDLADATNLGLRGWFEAMLRAMGSKPPLLSWLAQAFPPLSPVVGSVESALLMLNVVIQAVTLGLLYGLARRLGASVPASLAGMVLCGGASLHMGLTNQFLVEPLQELCVVALAWVASGSERLSRLRLVSMVSICIAASFLTKSSSFTFVVPLVTYVLVARLIAWREPKEVRSRADYALAAAAVVTLGLAIGWYRLNWPSMAQHFVNATSNEVALLYGSVGTLTTKLRFWTDALAIAISPTRWLLAAVGVTVLIAFAIGVGRIARAPLANWAGLALRTGFLFGGALAGMILVTLYGLSTQVNEETRFVSPLIPVLGALLAWSVTAVGSRAITAFFLAATSVNAVVGAEIAHAYNPRGLTVSVWLKPYHSDSAEARRLTSAVSDSCSPERHLHIAIIGVEYPSFNANSAAFYSAKRRRQVGYRCLYTSFGYAEQNVERAMERLDSIDPDYIATILPERQTKAADAFNLMALPAFERLSNDSRFQRAPSESNDVAIFQRLR